MINGKPTNENTIYYTLSITPAPQYDGRTPTVYVSTSSQAIENLRDHLIKTENTSHAGPPNVYQVDHMTIQDALRRRMVDQAIETANKTQFGQPPMLQSTGMTSHMRDIIVGPDFFHGPSQWILVNRVESVRTLMAERNQTLIPFREAAANTNPYKLFDAAELRDPQIKEAMEMAYAGKGIRHEAIIPAIEVMAKNGWDTAAMTPAFQEQYEHHERVLHAQHPEWGRHTLQNEALMETANTWRDKKCGNDMRQQDVFARIAMSCYSYRDAALAMDSTEKTTAIRHAQREVDAQLKTNGAGIISKDAQNFRQRVVQGVERRLGREVFTHAMVQGVIKETAEEFATRHLRGAIQYGEKEGKAGFENIARSAGEMERACNELGENDGMDEVSVDD